MLPNFSKIFSMRISHADFHWETKGGFVKGWLWRIYPRSGFRSGGTCAHTLVPVFVLGEQANVPSFRISFWGNIRQNHPFGKPPFCQPRDFWLCQKCRKRVLANSRLASPSHSSDLLLTYFMLQGCGSFGMSFSEKLGPVLGSTDFLWIFIFEPPDFFRGFCSRICSPHFCGKKCAENPRQNPPTFIQQNPQHISAEGPGQEKHFMRFQF